jgi:hypothetical protein
MFIGHTPQSFSYSENINSTCDNSVWRVDNGSSKAFDKFDNEYNETGRVTKNRKAQVLEILNDTEFNILQ